MNDWQSITALGIVATTVLLFLRAFWRRVRVPKSPDSCASGCGCTKPSADGRDVDRIRRWGSHPSS